MFEEGQFNAIDSLAALNPIDLQRAPAADEPSFD
jgi:hypothetical protein